MDLNSYDRRSFMKTTLAMGIAAASGSIEGAEEKNTLMGYIDAHSHIWTDDLKKYPLAGEDSKTWLKPPHFTAEELLELAGRHGVDRVVLIQHGPLHGTDNSYCCDMAEKHKGKFSVVAVIDDEAKSPDEEMRNLLKRHVRGFRIQPGKRPVESWLDGPGMSKMWTCGADTGMNMCFLINPDSFAAVGRMCAKYPETPVVIDHFGRVGMDGGIKEDELTALCQLAKHPKVRVKVSAFYALGKKAPPYTDLIPMIKRVIDAYGVERCMWASDCPYQIESPNTYGASIDLVKNADFLSSGDKEWLLRKTAETTFFWS
jgi:predicted TIM-barrel fold metal-dependent hydrolase